MKKVVIEGHKVRRLEKPRAVLTVRNVAGFVAILAVLAFLFRLIIGGV